MNLKLIQDSAERILKENATTILTAGGVVGTCLTAIVSFRAGAKSNEIIREEELKHVHPGGMEGPTDVLEGETFGLSNMQKARLIWLEAVPPVIITGATVGSIVAANMMSAKKAAALAAAYGVSQKSLEEYKAKVAEKLTGPKAQAIKDEIAQDRIDENPPKSEVIVLAGGDVLCYDKLTGRYFRSTVEQIQRAASEINATMMSTQCVGLSEFYDLIGLPVTNMSDILGWSMLNQDLPIELDLSTTMTPDQKPCIAIDFNVMPTPNYQRQYD